MSRRRTSARWPLRASAWALIAGMGAVADQNWVLLLCATLAIVAFWGQFLTEPKQ